MDDVLDVMVAATRAGGAVALAHFRRGVGVSLEADRSPVSVADREAEQAIAAVLARALPGHGLLGEELGEHGPTARRFIVDPIAGTRNFVRGIGYWAALIALEEDGVVTAGVIHQPVSDEVYTARRGQGARLDGTPIRVSEVTEMGEATAAHGTLRVIRRRGRWDGFVRLVDATRSQRGFGDFLGYAWLAAGRVDIALGLDLKIWDLAAPKIIVEEAGGRLTDLDGHDSLTSGGALATNGRLHAEALRLLAPAAG
ncbi:MAG TPA: inositol monophosphatase family protein [Methylomirabilota bacterium]|nr:inositol monophosphatase family protein [Methylomirabilota bacterium]